VSRLIAGRAGPLSQIAAEARSAARRARMIAELGFLTSQLAGLQAASRGQDVSDKAYAVEQRLNSLVNSLGVPTGPPTNQTISSGWANTVTNLTYTIPAAGGVFHIRAGYTAQQGTSAGGQSQLVGLTGPATNWVNGTYTDTNVGVTPPVLNHRSFVTTFGPFGTTAYTTSQVWLFEFEGNASFSAGGTLACGAGNAGGINWTVLNHYGYLIATQGTA
jgi:hypothetical protein